MNEIYNDLLFFKIWRNITIKNEILIELSKFRKNKCKEFKNRESLLKYKEREYIKKIIYSGKENLKVGDLPSKGILESIEILWTPILNKNIIPSNGMIKEIKFQDNISINKYDEEDDDDDLIDLIDLPNSITSVSNVRLFKNNQNIPSNIKSIHFIDFNDKLLIPDTVTSLKFQHITFDGGNLKKGFFKENLKTLWLFGDVRISNDILPNSLTDLKTSLQNDNDFKYFENGLLPRNLISLEIKSHGANLNIDKPILLPSTLKHLTLRIGSESIINSNCLPIGLESLIFDDYCKFANHNSLIDIITNCKSLTTLQLSPYISLSKFYELSNILSNSNIKTLIFSKLFKNIDFKKFPSNIKILLK